MVAPPALKIAGAPDLMTNWQCLRTAPASDRERTVSPILTVTTGLGWTEARMGDQMTLGALVIVMVIVKSSRFEASMARFV